VPENESELEDNILGIQGQLWSEMITADKQMQAMLCPRILGLAESAWSSEKNRRTSQELLSIAVNNFRGLFDQIGWDHYRAEEFEQVIDNESNINEVTA
jgi:hexosaminidase